MTDKQKIAGLFLGLALIAAGGFGWHYFLTSRDCDLLENRIFQALNNQDNLIFSFTLFSEHNLKEDQKEGFKKYIELKEPLIKHVLESYKSQCPIRKNQLIGFLKSYELYLVTKSGVFKENQAFGYNWIRQNFPYNPVYDSFE